MLACASPVGEKVMEAFLGSFGTKSAESAAAIERMSLCSRKAKERESAKERARA